MKDDPRYTFTDCFRDLSVSSGMAVRSDLEAVGQAYYDFRATLMQQRGEGLTKIYNRFHDPNESDPQIERLRELHAAMDRAVLTAYGFTDIPTDCDFILDYEDRRRTSRQSPASVRGTAKNPVTAGPTPSAMKSPPDSST